jgi:hypothetical protein
MLIKSTFNRGVIALTDLLFVMFTEFVKIIYIMINIINYIIRTINGVMDDIASLYFMKLLNSENKRINSIIDTFGLGIIILIVNIVLLIIGYTFGLLFLALVLLLEICPLPLFFTINVWVTCLIGIISVLLIKKTDDAGVPTSPSVFFNIIIIPLTLFSIVLFGFSVLDQITSVIRYEETILLQREIFNEVSKILFRKVNTNNNNNFKSNIIIDTGLNTNKQQVIQFRRKYMQEVATLFNVEHYLRRTRRLRKYLPISYTTTPLTNLSKRTDAYLLEVFTEKDFRDQMLRNPNNNLSVTFALENKVKTLINKTEQAKLIHFQLRKMNKFLLEPSFRNIYKNLYIKYEQDTVHLLSEFGPMKRTKYKKRFLPSKYLIQIQTQWKKNLLQHFDYQFFIPSYFLTHQNEYLHTKYHYYYQLSKNNNRIINLYFPQANLVLINDILTYTRLLKNFQFSNNNIINIILSLEKNLNNIILTTQKKNIYNLLTQQLFNSQKNKVKIYNTLNYKAYVMHGHITQFSKSALNEVLKVFTDKDTKYLTKRMLLLDQSIPLPLDSIFGLHQKFGEVKTNLPTTHNNIRFKKNNLSLYDYTYTTLFKNLSSKLGVEGNLLELDSLLLLNLKWNKQPFILDLIENKLGLSNIKKNLVNFSALKNNYFVFDGPNNNWSNLITDSVKTADLISIGKSKLPLYLENLCLSMINNNKYVYETIDQNIYRLEKKKKLYNIKYSLRLIQYNINNLTFFNENLNVKHLTLYDKVMNFIENIKINKKKAYNNLSEDEKIQLKKIHNKIKFTHINNTHITEIPDYIPYKYLSRINIDNLTKFAKYNLKKMQLSDSILNLSDDCMQIITKSKIQIKETFIINLSKNEFNVNLMHTVNDILCKKEIGYTKKHIELINKTKQQHNLLCSPEVREKALAFLERITEYPINPPPIFNNYLLAFLKKYNTDPVYNIKFVKEPILNYVLDQLEIITINIGDKLAPVRDALNIVGERSLSIFKIIESKKKAIDSKLADITYTAAKNSVYTIEFTYSKLYGIANMVIKSSLATINFIESKKKAIDSNVADIVEELFRIFGTNFNVTLVNVLPNDSSADNILTHNNSPENILLKRKILKKQRSIERARLIMETTQQDLINTMLNLYEEKTNIAQAKNLLYEQNYITQMQLIVLTDPKLIKLATNFNQLRLPKGLLFKYLIKQGNNIFDIDLIDKNETLSKILALFKLKPIEEYKKEKKYFDIKKITGDSPFRLIHIKDIDSFYVRDFIDILLEKLFKLNNFKNKPKDSLLLAIQKEIYSSADYQKFLNDQIFRLFARQIQTGVIVTRKKLSLLDYQQNNEQINEIMLKFTYLYLKQSPSFKLTYFLGTTRTAYLTKYLENEFPGTRAADLYDKWKHQFFQISKTGPLALDNYLNELNKQINRLYEADKNQRVTQLQVIPKLLIEEIKKFPLNQTAKLLQQNGFKLNNQALHDLWLTISYTYYKREVVDVEQMIRNNASPEEEVINDISFLDPNNTHLKIRFFEVWHKLRLSPQGKQTIIQTSKHDQIELTKKTRKILYEWYALDLKNKTDPLVYGNLAGVYKEFLTKINTMTRVRNLYGTALLQAILYNNTIQTIETTFPPDHK